MIKLRNVSKIMGVLSGTLIILFLVLFAWVDRTPYKETAYYQSTIQRLEHLNPDTIAGADRLKIGWARVNITPDRAAPLAGYGKRRGKKFLSVNDSVWVRAFVFDDGRKKSTLVTADLLILPPEVNQRVQKFLTEIGFHDSFFSASHSHSSFGGWAPGLTGRLFAGEYDPATVDLIVDRIVKAVQLADRHKSTASIGYAAFKTEGLVYNRLVGERGRIDPWLRIIQMKQIGGGTAIFTSFSAHSTCLSSEFFNLSGDYPGLLVQALEARPDVDFAAFGAGAMGSQGPVMTGIDELARATEIARDLADQIGLGLNSTTTSFTTKLSTAHLDIDLRDPHFRISTNLRIRPWLFNLLVAHYQVDIKALKIGNILLIGTPCDFSGELVEDLEQMARQKGLNLMVTSFNGGYMGYVTKDKWYDEDLYETRTMNWYGPYNGAYFCELISGIIDIF